MIYYIADLHLGHRNVISFDSRPFESPEDMEERMVCNWNARISDDDTVYVLGDAFWKNEAESIITFRKLKGHKHLIRGNHDRIHGRLGSEWESVQPYAEIADSGRLVILCHYPLMFYRNQRYGAVMLHGHVHNSREWQLGEKWKEELWSLGIPNRMINVGCMMDYMGYTPRTLEELLSANPMPELPRADKNGNPLEDTPKKEFKTGNHIVADGIEKADSKCE